MSANGLYGIKAILMVAIVAIGKVLMDAFYDDDVAIDLLMGYLIRGMTDDRCRIDM